jgi:paraquat-inducible protein B
VRRRRLFRLVWVVPVMALAVAGYLVFQHMRALGPSITIRFADASGLRIGQTPVNYRGVQIGEVTGIALTQDRRQAVVKVRLHRSAAPIAAEGAQFWIVRPEVGWGNVTGLNTVLSGPEIQVLPGRGEKRVAEFTGLDNAPVAAGEGGLRLVLRAERPKGVRVNTPVNYRGVEVGLVHKIELAPGAASADLHILIRSRYATLVRDGSAFWNTSGVQASGGILKGIELELESLRTLFTGSIEFATPSEKAPRAKAGTVFFLHDKPKDEWLNWTARIPLGGQAGQEKQAQEKPGKKPAAESAAVGASRPVEPPEKAWAN